jgi:hypothetical protein
MMRQDAIVRSRAGDPVLRISLDAAPLDRNTVPDVIILHTRPTWSVADLLLFRSAYVPESAQGFYRSETTETIEQLLKRSIKILSIVSERFSSQAQRLSFRSKSNSKFADLL